MEAAITSCTLTLRPAHIEYLHLQNAQCSLPLYNNNTQTKKQVCNVSVFSSLLLSKVHEEPRELVQLLTLGKQRNISDLEVDGAPHPCWWRWTQCAKRRCSNTSHCCKTLFCVPVCLVKVCCLWENGCLLVCVHFFCFLKKFVPIWVQQNATNLVLWKSTTQLKGGGSFLRSTIPNSLILILCSVT